MRGFYYKDEGDGTGPLTRIGDYVGEFSGGVFVEHSLPLMEPNTPEHLAWDGSQVSQQSGYLSHVLEEALNAIDLAANDAAERNSSSRSHSMGATYRVKLEEANKYKSDGTIGPYLDAESTRKNVTVSTLADQIITQADAWQATKDSVNPLIEAERTGGKDDTRVAYNNGDIQGIREACDNAVSELEAI